METQRRKVRRDTVQPDSSALSPPLRFKTESRKMAETAERDAAIRQNLVVLGYQE